MLLAMNKDDLFHDACNACIYKISCNFEEIKNNTNLRFNYCVIDYGKIKSNVK